MMKKILKSLLVLTLVLSLSTACGKKKDTNSNTTNNTQEDLKVDTNEGVIGDQQVGVFKFEKTSLIYNNGTSVLQLKITNTSEETQVLSRFRIHVMNGDEEIATLEGYLGAQLKPGESRVITTSRGEDLTSATSINYEI